MVYESDFYTTRRPYSSSSRPTVSSYSVTRNNVDWEKVPFVPRPSLVADPITAFGKRKSNYNEKPSILNPINRAKIKPNQEILNRPIAPYVSARDATRNRVYSEIKRYSDLRNAGGCQALVTDKGSMDMLLPQLHRTAAVKSPHRQVFFVEPTKYKY